MLDRGAHHQALHAAFTGSSGAARTMIEKNSNTMSERSSFPRHGAEKIASSLSRLSAATPTAP
jgi:hypothetical protein